MGQKAEGEKSKKDIVFSKVPVLLAFRVTRTHENPEKRRKKNSNLVKDGLGARKVGSP